MAPPKQPIRECVLVTVKANGTVDMPEKVDDLAKLTTYLPDLNVVGMLVDMGLYATFALAHKAWLAAPIAWKDCHLLRVTLNGDSLEILVIHKKEPVCVNHLQ